MTTESPPRPVTIRCPSCNRLNRVDLRRLGDGPKCGGCQLPLRLDAPVPASEADFDRIVNSAGVPVVVDFYADWCGPCKIMAPVLDKFARDRKGDVLVLKVDTDRNAGVSQRFGIRGIPTIIAFDRGKERGRLVGAVDRQALDGLLAG
ncbi:MAG: thioredoxin [Gemmatimonadota bacterium]